MSAFRRFAQSIWIWVAAVPVVAFIAIFVSLFLVGCVTFDEHIVYPKVKETAHEVKAEREREYRCVIAFDNVAWVFSKVPVSLCAGWAVL